MTIGNYGTMEIKDNNTLTSFVSLYFPLWYYQFNYENYTSNIYPKLLNSTYDSSNNEEIHKLNIEYVISQKKTLNDLIIWELKTIESQLISINKYLQELNIFDIHLNFNSKRHERTYKEILIRLENYESRTQGEIHLIEIIRNAEENWLLYFLGILLKDYNRIKEFLIKNVDTEIQTSEPQQAETKQKQSRKMTETTFEQLFKDPQNANISLNKLREVFPNLLSDDYSYIKGIKGIFPMFIECLNQLNYINYHPDIIYKNALNSKIKNLNLSKDASEFRKNYKTLTDGKRTDLKLSLSQISH